MTTFAQDMIRDEAGFLALTIANDSMRLDRAIGANDAQTLNHLIAEISRNIGRLGELATIFPIHPILTDVDDWDDSDIPAFSD